MIEGTADMDREAGFYWVKLKGDDDWEPAVWTSNHWVMLGTEVDEDSPEEPEEIGNRIEPPL